MRLDVLCYATLVICAGSPQSCVGFEARRGVPLGDSTEDAAPLGQLLRRALGTVPGDQQKAVDRSAMRYRLWEGL